MAQQVGDDFVVNVDALIAVGIDPATLRTAVNQAEQFGKNFGSSIAGAANKSFGSMAEDLTKALTGAKTKGERDRAIREISRQYENLAKEVLAAAQQVGRSVGGMDEGLGRTASQARATSDAVGGVGDAFDRAAASARRMAAGTDNTFDRSATDADAFAASIRKINAAVDGMEQNFASLSNIISASLGKARTEFAVIEQTAQQFRGIAKQQERLQAQAAKDQARVSFQEQKALDRQREQERAASLRSSLTQQKSALAQENAAFNASLQSNLVAEKGFQQRRTALVQAGLLATRSLYQGLASGTSSVVSAAYSAIVSATKRGEDQVTAANRQGLQERRAQQERFAQQSIADVRRQQGAAAAVQAQVNQGGVIGAVTGQSAAGNLLRGGLFGAGAVGGALGLRQLTEAASGFEANLRVFAALNDELGDTPGLLEQIRQTSLDLGNDIALPGVSAADAASAITALAKTGLDLEDSMGAARGSLLLARFAGIDFAESARTIGSTLNALKLEGSDATAVVDGFSAALKNSGGATFDELRQAQSQSLLVFRNAFAGAERPLEIMNNLNASLALFSRNALRGSDAGTSLKTFISSLSGLSDKTKGMIEDLVLSADRALAGTGKSFGGGNFLFRANGEARTFAETIDLIKVAFRTLDPKQRAEDMRTIFGSDAIRAAQIFFNTQEDELANLVAEIESAGGLTEKLAKAQNQGLKASLDAFISTIETAFIKVFAVVDKPLGKIITAVSDGIGALVNDKAFGGLRTALLGVAAALTAVLAAKGGLEVLRLTGILLSSFASPLGAVILALSAVGAAIGFVLGQSEPLRQALGRLFDRIREGGAKAAEGPLGKIGEVFQRVRAQVERAAEVVGFFITLLIDSDIRKRFIEWQELDPNVEKEGLLGFFLNLIDAVPKVVKAIIDGFKEAVSFIKRVATDPSFETFRKAVLGAAAGVGALVVAIKGINAAKVALTGLRTVATVAAGFASPFGIAAIAIGALAAGFVILYQKSEPFRRLVDGLVEGVKEVALTVLRAAMPALEAFAGVIKDSAGKALEGLQGVLESVVAFVGSAGFTNALTKVGEIVGGVIERIAAGFQRVVDFITAVSRVISDLGVFEGLRGAVVVAFEGITGFIGDIFSTIGETIAGFFSGIDWATVAATAAAGIFNFFRTIGRTVGRFIGSKEFLTTVAAALAALAATIASAAGGLVTGLIEGLRDSDAGQQIIDFFGELIGLGSDEIEGSGDVVAEAVRKATVDGLTLALSAAFPPELFRRLFTDPLGSALGAAVLLVEVLFIGKIVKMFVTGFQTVQRTIQGIALAPKVLQGGLASISDDLRNTGAAARNNAQDLSRVNQQYGTFAGRIVKVADTVNGFGKGQEQVASTTQAVSKNIDGQTAALLRNEAAARGNLGQVSDLTKAERDRASVLTNVKDNYLSLAGAIAGGAVAGVGIGTALTADDPLGKIASITAAIGGIGTIAVTTAQVVAASGLTAGLLTGGVGLAVAAITTAIAFFTSRRNEVEAAARAADAAQDSYVQAFKAIYDAAQGSSARATLEFLSELEDSSSGAFAEVRGQADELGITYRDLAQAITGVGGASDDFLADIEQQTRTAKDELASLVEQFGKYGQFDVDRQQDLGIDAEAEIARLRELVSLLENFQGNVDALRGAYSTISEDASAELLIRRELKKIEEERQTSLDSVVEKTRDAQTALEAQVSALQTIADLEAGRTDVPRAERELRQGLRSIVDSFLPTKDENGNVIAPEASFAAPINSAEFDAALEITERYRTQIATIAADTANNAATQEEYNQKIREQAAAYQRLLEESGATPEVANQIVQGLFNGFTSGKQVINAFLTEYKDDIGALQAALEQPWVTEIVATVDEGPARSALEAFIASPDAKSVEALFDLGIPKEVLAAFIREPSEKTIQPIIAALTGADEQQLAALVAAANKPIVPFVDQAALARARQQLQAGIGVGVYRIDVQESALNRDLNGNGIIGSKYGRIITEPTLSWLGEEGRKEVVIPLTMPNRAAQLYQQSGLANVLAKAGVMAPGTAPAVQRVVATTGGSGPTRQEFDRVVGVLESLRGDLREDMDTRRDNVFLMEGVEKPYPTARETASKLRRKRRRR
jgi:TP901 family phage tail tape measure protein